MEEATLPKASMVRLDRIYSLSRSTVVRRLGRIKQATFGRIVVLLNRQVAS
jgi:hypothetical protein